MGEQEHEVPAGMKRVWHRQHDGPQATLIGESAFDPELHVECPEGTEPLAVAPKGFDRPKKVQEPKSDKPAKEPGGAAGAGAGAGAPEGGNRLEPEVRDGGAPPAGG